MMKRILFSLAMISAACNNNEQQTQTTTQKTDTVYVKPGISELIKPEPVVKPPSTKVYSNVRFKNITVEKTSEHQFSITGQAQVFEANVSWVVEDGHDELKKGFVTTDAGAPEWGNFAFSINVQKKQQNSTLHLILFETSAKDGSRQHELPIVLY